MGLYHDTAMARGGRIKLGLAFSGRLGEQMKPASFFFFLSNARVNVSLVAYVIALQIFIIVRKTLVNNEKDTLIVFEVPEESVFFSLRAEA